MSSGYFYYVLFMLILISCSPQRDNSSSLILDSDAGNLLREIRLDDIKDFQWLNKPDSFTLENNELAIVALKETDYFNNPEDGTISASAPILYVEQEGDFVAKALVKPDFASMWNAACLMVHIDSLNWIKFAFENSDATGPGIVSVVTKDVSDDANGAVLDTHEEVWLKMVRKGNIYSMLWSLDDKEYKMARLTTLPAFDKVKIGVEAQCPVGESAKHIIKYFGIEERTVKDLRKGE